MDRKGEKDVGKMENRRSRSAFVHFLRQKAGKGRAVHFGGAGLYLQRVRRKTGAVAGDGAVGGGQSDGAF